MKKKTQKKSKASKLSPKNDLFMAALSASESRHKEAMRKMAISNEQKVN